jgi:ABC-type Fe3+-hydroxamate transport system substrate-binding protein
MRVVSLVPSLTELVFDLGRGGWLVGRTRFCDTPAGALAIESIGGTKDPDVRRIVEIAPGLVIANKEENRREDVEALRAAGLDVLLTDPNSIKDALAMIRVLGLQVDAIAAADQLCADIERELAAPLPSERRRVFVAVWNRPLLGLGGESYGHDVLVRAGANNVLGHRPRYPEVSLEEVEALQPDLILLPDEPFHFRERHAREFGRIAPARLVDGRLLWWYGPRIPAAMRELRRLLAE